MDGQKNSCPERQRKSEVHTKGLVRQKPKSDGQLPEGWTDKGMDRQREGQRRDRWIDELRDERTIRQMDMDIYMVGQRDRQT